MAKAKATTKKRAAAKNETTVFTYGRYSVVRDEGGYYVRNVELDVNEEATTKLFEAIRLCKAFEKHLQAAIEWEPKDWVTKPQDEEEVDETFDDERDSNRFIN